jgi:hypothetical protein
MSKRRKKPASDEDEEQEPDYRDETRGQREERRRKAREALRAQRPVEEEYPVDTAAGQYGALDEELMTDLLAEFGYDVDGVDATGEVEGNDVFLEGYGVDTGGDDDAAKPFQPDPRSQSKQYQIDEIKGKMRSLGFMVRMFAWAVEGKPILNVVTDDVTGEVILDPLEIRL